MHCKGKCDTIMYMAPEVFDGGATLKSDIWSLGITLIELATCINPFVNLEDDEIMKRICDQDPPSLSSSQWSADFIDFVNNCLIKDVNKRPSAEKLVNVNNMKYV